MNAEGLIRAVFDETRSLVAVDDALTAFASGLSIDLPLIKVSPRALPVTDRIGDLLTVASEETRGLVAAIAAASAALCWEQSYSKEEVGAHYLANYGWFNLASPGGPFVSEALRVSVGYWEAGLTYPQHAHEPEEMYVVLAGEAVVKSEGCDPVRAKPGTIIRHTPNQWHGFTMEDRPLLAMAFWKGDGLMNKSRLERVA